MKSGMSHVQADQGNVLDRDPDDVSVSIGDCMSKVEVVQKVLVNMIANFQWHTE